MARIWRVRGQRLRIQPPPLPPWLHRRWRRGTMGSGGNGDFGSLMGSMGPLMGSARLSMSFSFFLFDLPRQASNRLRKCPTYRDLMSEAVVMPASVNLFCPPRIIFYVVVKKGDILVYWKLNVHGWAIYNCLVLPLF
jgi:hypothetical protein